MTTDTMATRVMRINEDDSEADKVLSTADNHLPHTYTMVPAARDQLPYTYTLQSYCIQG